jgi:hypothetical protein
MLVLPRACPHVLRFLELSGVVRVMEDGRSTGRNIGRMDCVGGGGRGCGGMIISSLSFVLTSYLLSVRRTHTLRPAHSTTLRAVASFLCFSFTVLVRSTYFLGSERQKREQNK